MQCSVATVTACRAGGAAGALVRRYVPSPSFLWRSPAPRPRVDRTARVRRRLFFQT